MSEMVERVARAHQIQAELRCHEAIRAEANAVVDRGYNEGLVDAVCAALLAAEKRGEDREMERCAGIADDEARKCAIEADAAQAAGRTAEMYGRNNGFHSAVSIANCIRSSGGGNG